MRSVSNYSCMVGASIIMHAFNEVIKIYLSVINSINFTHKHTQTPLNFILCVEGGKEIKRQRERELL